MSTTTNSIITCLDNEYIYYDYEKYLVALKSIKDENFITLLQQAETKTENNNLIPSQKIIYENLKNAKGIYARYNILNYYNGFGNEISIKTDSTFKDIENSKLKNEDITYILEKIFDFEIFKVMARVFGIIPFDIIRTKLRLSDITMSKWIIENSNQHYMDNTHFFECLDPTKYIFYKKYFDNFTYPILSQDIIKSKLENAIRNANVFFTEFWLKKYTWSEEIVVNIYRSSSLVPRYKVAEILINSGNMEKMIWTDLSPKNYEGTIFEKLFVSYLKKIENEKFMKQLEIHSLGMETEIINFLIQKLNNKEK